MKKSLLLLLSCCFFLSLSAQDNRAYTTARPSSAIVLDGTDNDSCWAVVEWQGDFIQHEPLNGREPSQKTRFKILYDDAFMYVLIHAQDKNPDSIVRRLSRRDDLEGDNVGVQFDSYHDKLTAFTFMVNAAGVKSDFLSSDENEEMDDTWDPVWYTKTSMQADGWMAELKIPLSQLRFDSREEVWGLQLFRFLFRKQELSTWKHIPKDSPGWVRQFGLLEGIADLHTRRQVEIAPYYVARLTRNPAGSDNPFETRNNWNLTKMGLDSKIGLSNNFILDLTINPDFGQVEADPSEVNLTAYETYFEEKRPFFIEGKNLFAYSLMGGDGDFSEEGLFYSRRIGRRPQYEPELAEGEYADMPEFTRILGAAKISGKTRNGLSIGILESITAPEICTIDSLGKKRKLAVEPLTSYSAARVQKEFDKGNTVLGGIFTATHRNLGDEHLRFLPSAAYSGGLNFSRYWKERNYYFDTKVNFSSVHGSTESMIALQEAPARYFQRPDADHTDFDSSRNSLSGSSGKMEIGKMGGGHWRYSTFLTWKSPGFELNDIGYLRTTDELTHIVWVGYQIWEPVSIFKNINLNLSGWTEYNFALIKSMNGGNFNFNAQLKNYWSINGGINLMGSTRWSTLLRGGPMFITPGSAGLSSRIQSDERKKLIFEVSYFKRMGFENYSGMNRVSMEITCKPFSFVRLSLEPEYGVNFSELQYVNTVEFGSEKRYIFGSLHQKTLDLSLRANISFSPSMSLQFWGQPFVATGEFSSFKMVTNPLDTKYAERTHTFSNSEIRYDDGIWEVRENGGTSAPYTFEEPGFNWSEFKSNLVFRWEYFPGSALFLVWSQNRDYSSEDFLFSPSDDMQKLFTNKPYNTFLLKFSYRFRA